jgi:hypothetical protein
VPQRQRLRPAVSVALLLSLTMLVGGAATDEEQAKVQLFNGKDLDGWYPILGGAGPDGKPLAENNDPRRVFSVVTEDGRAAIRVSGEVTGGLTTRRSFSNYHLRVAFKWGKKRWPPREDKVRDSGILYHCVGAPAPNTGWMTSAEYQVEEMDCGDYWSVHKVICDVETRRMDATDELRKVHAVWSRRNDGTYPPIAYHKGGTRVTLKGGAGLMKEGDAEKPTGEWNIADLYCVGNTSVHVINGLPVMVLTNLRLPVEGGREEPLTGGKIQLQSEGAEIFFRDLELEPIDEIPRQAMDGAR